MEITENKKNRLCEGNSPVTGEFPVLMASNEENVSFRSRHHDLVRFRDTCTHCDHYVQDLYIWGNAIDRNTVAIKAKTEKAFKY